MTNSGRLLREGGLFSFAKDQCFPILLLVNPCLEKRDLFFGHGFLAFRRGHHFFRVVGKDAMPQFAFVQVSRYDGPDAVAFGESSASMSRRSFAFLDFSDGPWQ